MSTENTIAKTLRERRLRVWEDAKALADRVSEENRNFSGEEEARWNALNGEIDAIDRRIQAVVEGEKRARELDEQFNNLTGNQPANREHKQDEELRAFLRRGGPKEFAVPSLWTPERRDLSTSSSGVIPSGFRSQLWESAVESSGILNAGVDMLQTDSGETIKLPRVTAYSTAASVSEAAAITESDPTLSSVDSVVTKQGFVTQISRELVDDNGVDLEGRLARWAGRELGLKIGSAAVTAALAAASAGATTAAGTAGGFGAQGTAEQGFDYLITLYHSVIDPYRQSSSCSWLMSDATAAKVRKIKSTEGVYVWQPSVVAGEPASGTILGKPVYIDTHMPDAAVSVESILFGDFRSLVVRVAGGVRFERSDEFSFNTDQVTYRALVRHGTVSVDSSALKSLTHAGT